MSSFSPLGIAISAAAIIPAMIVSACGAGRPDNAAAFSDIRSQHSGDEVIVEGIVTHVGRTTRGSAGVHEHFDVLITSGSAEQEVLVADNTSIGIQAPVRRGDDVIVKGVLEIDPSGPVIHWTHHDPAFRHEGGYVVVGGKMYD